MKVTKDIIGSIVCLKNQTNLIGLNSVGKVLEFHHGPSFTDVDVELADGNVINTTASNLEESGVVDILQYKIAKAILPKSA